MRQEREAQATESTHIQEQSPRLTQLLKNIDERLDRVNYGLERRVVLFEGDFSMVQKGENTYAIEIGGGEIVDFDLFTRRLLYRMKKIGKVTHQPIQSIEDYISGKTTAARFHREILPTQKVPVSIIESKIKAEKGFNLNVFRQTFYQPGPTANPLTLMVYAEIDTDNWSGNV